MSKVARFAPLCRGLIVLLVVLVGMFSSGAAANAHPLGNFTINHFARLNIDSHQVTVEHVVDMAEIPAFQALQTADANGDRATSNTELNAYLGQVTPHYVEGLALQIDQQIVPLEVKTQAVSLPPGAGGLSTLRLEWTLIGAVPPVYDLASHELGFEDTNDRTRIGWREIVVVPNAQMQVFNSSAYSNSLTDALRAYPQDLLTTPLQESTAHLSFTSGKVPADATPLLTREGQPIIRTPNLFTKLAEWKAIIFTPNYQRLPLMPQFDWTTASGMAMAIAAAFLWGAMHSLSPGHGKTLVGAYLVGTKATPQHALFLALTTTVTHTIGVFALGLITLFAAEYVLPEQLYPWLSLGSGIMVIAIGGNLLTQRLRYLRTVPSVTHQDHLTDPSEHHSPAIANLHSHVHSDLHSHSDSHSSLPSHSHSHLSVSILRSDQVSEAALSPPSLPHSLHHSHDHAENLVQNHTNVLTLHVSETSDSKHSHGITHNHDRLSPDHSHDHRHDHSHDHDLDHAHSHEQGSHSHLPGADGLPVTWQSLLALGISGGLMPCPAALVLLLGAIALGKVGFGLLLVFVFSLGLAGVLTGLGLLLVYAKHRFKDVPVSLHLVRGLPVIGALGMTIVGVGISARALLDISDKF